MATWRDLGEVPDSDDDGDFDSQGQGHDSAAVRAFDSDQQNGDVPSMPQTVPTEKSPDHAENNINKSIWDVPASSPAEDSQMLPSLQRPSTPDARIRMLAPQVSSPLSSVPDDDELAEMFTEGPAKAGAFSITKLAGVVPSRSVSPDPLDFGVDDISAGLVKLSEPPPDFLLDQGPAIPVLQQISPQSIRHPRSTPPSTETACAIAAAVTAAQRYERSLRPRKPIQEHPYMIESAQYNKALKARGIRPVRMAEESQARGRINTPEENSQEQEFQEESQSTISESQGLFEESQPLLHESLNDSAPSPIYLSSSATKASSQPRLSAPSSPFSVSRETNATSPFIGDYEVGSGEDDDELPSLEQMLTARAPSSASKRRPSPTTASSRKWAKNTAPDSTLEITPHQPLSLHSTQLKFRRPRPLPPAVQGPKISSTNSRWSRVQLPKTAMPETATPFRPQAKGSEQKIVETSIWDLSDASHADEAPATETGEGSDSNSSHGTEMVTFGRRARGVLPASHFRLDQPKEHPKAHQSAHARPVPPDSIQRRGVAVRRLPNLPGQSPAAVLPLGLFDDESETETLATPKPDTEKQYSQLVLHIEEDDGDVSVVEENDVDHMVQRGKRQLNPSDSRGSSAKRRKLDQPGTKQCEQPTITSHFATSNGSAVNYGKKQKSSMRVRGQDKQPRKKAHKPSKPHSAPRLGILDVIEPEAPRFLTIAARTVKNKSQQGRSSPRKKTICLSTRKDQLDAGRVLQDWTNGTICPRPATLDHSGTGRGSSRQPLAHISHNGASSGSSEFRDDGLARLEDSAERLHHANTTFIGLVRSKRNSGIKTPSDGSRALPQNTNARARPAQFEADVANEAGKVGFQAKKRMMDAIYHRRSCRSPSLSPLSHVSRNGDDSFLMDEDDFAVRENTALKVTKSSRGRLKKVVRPTRVDTSAPQYRHAHDPLPAEFRVDKTIGASSPKTHQLLGLAPFGVHYSEHFEAFPLERGAFFHQETLVGSGCFKASLEACLSGMVKQSRPRVYFNLSGQPLRWGPWDEQVSSEFGIMVDAIFSNLAAPTTIDNPSFDAKDAASFIRAYVQDALDVAEDAKLGFFLSRLRDVFGGFLRRLGSEPVLLDPDKTLKAVEVLSQFLVVILCGFSICRDNSSMVTQVMSLEELLGQMTTTFVACLLRLGTGSVVTLYMKLQRLTDRERGIRADDVAAQAWVMLMRALGHLKIPRMSFWDVTYSVLIRTEDKTGLDAQRFEQLWEIMFALLPLCEFDVSGILVPESRYSVAMDGWALPQLALKRVFQLYQDNNRQLPGFNDYCRALVRRCVYLVEQWGWYKCSGVIGTIFDFFGSQNLSHLRNEEVFKSPAFLEHLSVETTLRVEPEDRCFHIFLKLIASGIRRLVKTGSFREVRNLVARTLPNHNRQYLKEQNVHQHDLAALRNHHDLLCTLFWATPAELRPGTLLTLLEKLVTPSSSHKEACLINLRAWAQLARFVVREESVASFKVFSLWQRSAFQQLLDQYNSTASDIEQQASSMSKNVSRGISQNMINGIIASNKSATMEVLRYSVVISLDVAKHAKSLELAVFAGNLVQLQHVFRQFARSPSEYPLGMLIDGIATLDVFLNNIEGALAVTDPEHEGQMPNPKSLDDAIMQLDNDLTADFFSMARGMLQIRSAADDTPHAMTKREDCMEQMVIVAGRLAAILIRCGTMRLSRCFKTSQRTKTGKHELFEGLPCQLDQMQSRYLPLFLANVHTEMNMTDVGVSVLQLWLLSLVKPKENMTFEYRFALCLQKHGYPFVPVESGIMRHASYEVNCDMLRKTLVWMRASLRTSSTPSIKKANASDYSTALKGVMQQMQNDLHNFLITNKTQHPRYVDFVRRAVSLVKSHATEIFQVPAFFYQVSKEYSPPVQDPQLQIDSIKSYGIRLSEGDPPVLPQLFYYLYNNFKQALLHGKLRHETRMLAKGMGEDAIFGFILGIMLPVVLSVSVIKPEAFILFDTYCEAVSLRSKGPAGRQMNQSCAQIATLVQGMLRWIREVQGLNGGVLCAEHVHLFRKMITLLTMLRPALAAASFISPLPAYWSDMQQALTDMSRALSSAECRLASSLADPYEDEPSAGLFLGFVASNAIEQKEETLTISLATSTITDFERNWVVTAETIAAQAPARATQTFQGLKRPHWVMEELGHSLLEELRIWNAWWARCRAHVQDEAIGKAEDMMLL